MQMTDNVRLAIDTICQKPTRGIPSFGSNIMEHRIIEKLAGAEEGQYARDPYEVYLRMQHSIGSCMIDQYIPENPLSMGDHGFTGGGQSATTGKTAILNGITIDSPEAVAEHMERFVLPQIKGQIARFNESSVVQDIMNEESHIQQLVGPEIFKGGYAAPFPHFMYDTYGYEQYFMAYALYPDVIGSVFRQMGDYAALYNTALVKAFRKAARPFYMRLDHDMADGSGTLVSLQSLEKLWLQHFQRSIMPMAEAGFKLVWHSDGNLMKMYPYLIECGVNGFQGFQYEFGMDYIKICSMKTRDGGMPLIIAGVSVTRTLPFGTPEDVRKEMAFLVENGPPVGLFLSMSSSCTPGTPVKNIETYIEGLRYYRVARHNR
jgi:hypothetical protein